MANFVLTTVGTAGDLAPYTLLGPALKRRGHAVTLVTHCGYEGECKKLGLNFIALDTPAEFERFIQDGALLNSGSGIPKFLRRHVIPSLLSDYEIIRACCTPETVVVAPSSQGIAPRLVAEKMRLPYISILGAPHYISAEALCVTLLESVFAAEINDARAALGLPGVSDWGMWWRTATLNIGLWPSWLSPLPPSAPANMQLVGFLWRRSDKPVSVPDEFRRIVEGSQPPILITGGTGVFGGKEFYTVSAEASKYLGRPTILVNRFPELMPDACLPSNVHSFDYIESLGDTMPQMVAIIHHGGATTLIQSLSAGIPQAIMAVGGDRPENALCAQRLGVGKYLPRPQWDAKLVAEEVERLLASESVRASCRQVSGWFAQTDSLSRLCDALEATAANDRTYLDAAFRRAISGPETSLPTEKENPVSHPLANIAALTLEQQALLSARLRIKKQALERK